MNELQEIVFSNYEDIRDELLRKYDIYVGVKKEYGGIFYTDINYQFVDIVQKYITMFLSNRTVNVKVDDIKIYVEEVFTFDNIERIISEDGEM